MACCGSGKVAGGSPGLRRGTAAEPSRIRAPGPGEVQYGGARPVTVIGPVTGQRYRFAAGGVAMVDARDRQALAGQPGFKLR